MTNTREGLYKLSPYILDIGVDEDGIREYADRRLVFMNNNVFAKMVDDMEQVIGPVIQQRIKDFGRNAGLNIGKKMTKEFDDVSTKEKISLLFKSNFKISALKAIKETDSKSQMQKLLGYGTFVGWMGKGEITDYENEQSMTLHVNHTFESHSYGTTGRKECRFFSGAVEGIMGYLWDKDVEVEETRCDSESVNQEACIFEVKAVET